MKKKALKIAVLGAGSFGTAMAQLIAENGHKVFLFGRDPKVIFDIQKRNINTEYFPRLKLNPRIIGCHVQREKRMICDADLVVFALPSGVTREMAKKLRSTLQGKPILSTAKGIDCPSLAFMTEVIRKETGNPNLSSFSGPTFADEMIHRNLTAATFGVADKEQIDYFSNIFGTHGFICDYSFDVAGVELCGVLKNIYALAMGVFDSISFSHNGHHAFLNLCFKELKTILTVFSKDSEIAFKFCGFGDFNLTANTDKSRNRTLGLLLGKQIIDLGGVNSSIVFEGLKSAKAIQQKCQKAKVSAPILDFVNDVLIDSYSLKAKLSALVDRLCRNDKT